MQIERPCNPALLIESVPFWYSTIPMFIWNCDMGFLQHTFCYWGIWPAFGSIFERVEPFSINAEELN